MTNPITTQEDIPGVVATGLNVKISRVWIRAPHYAVRGAPFKTWAVSEERYKVLHRERRKEVPIVARPMKGSVYLYENRIVGFECDGLQEEFTLKPVKKHGFTPMEIVERIIGTNKSTIIGLRGTTLKPTFSRVIRDLHIRQRAWQKVVDTLSNNGLVYVNEQEVMSMREATGYWSPLADNCPKDVRITAQRILLDLQTRNPDVRGVGQLDQSVLADIAHYGLRQVI